MKTLVIGSRGSKLALTQAGMVQQQLQAASPSLQVEIKVIKTSGDASAKPLSIIGGKGVFTKELEDALISGAIDIAVHSLKDLPTIVPDGLLIAAVCRREDARDALVLPSTGSASGLKEVNAGLVIGTSSPRRLAQLKHSRPDLVVKDLRGNVDTRLRKLDEGQYGALILACAGLRRLGLEKRITAALPTDEMLPAVGQGALAIEVRADDVDAIANCEKLNDAATEAATDAERALLRRLGGGCQLPIAAHAMVDNQSLTLDGLVAAVDGSKIVRASISGHLREAEKIGHRLAEELLASGASELLST